MRTLITNESSSRRADFFIPNPESNYWVQASGVPVLVPIPPEARYVVFSFPDGNYGVKYGDSSVVAALPSTTGETTDIHDLNPSQRHLPGGEYTHLSLVGNTNHAGLITFYG
jgi:hypothetical protein